VPPPRRSLALALCGALLLCGCGRGDEELSAACPETPHEVLTALKSAPAPVRMDGRGLGECLADASDVGELQQVGGAYVQAAADLSREARGDPEGPAALRLGYLVGAARHGGASTQGVHAELLRRLEQEAAPIRARSRALRRGEAAGRRGG
jgi:hypothetical protein